MTAGAGQPGLLRLLISCSDRPRARDRGVKLVGATAHYVTEELNAGPIIEQDVMRLSHRDDVDALAQLGADVERLVLARAVQAHCQDRVSPHGNTTVVF